MLSGNRNFEGRVHPHCRLNYLASPPLVVAYALAGTMPIDLTSSRWATTRTASRSISRYLADRRRDPCGHRRRDHAGALSRALCRRLCRRRRWRDCQSAAATPSTGATGPDTSRRRRSSPTCGATAAARRFRGRARPGDLRRLRSRPTTSRRSGRSARKAPPAISVVGTASRRGTSIPSARGASITT